MIYIAIYLITIVCANLSIVMFGPSVAIINAFIFIGVDLSIRDKLHMEWKGEKLWLKMAMLIIAGSVISVLFNLDAARIAAASAAAFLFAGLIDTGIFQKLIDKNWMIRANGSNVGGAAADSIMFPLLAFGFFPGVHWIILGQFAAKVAGGFVAAWVISRYGR